MKTGVVYLHLSRDERTAGPAFGPYEAIHFVGNDLIRMERSGSLHTLMRADSSIYYDGAYYPDCSIRAVSPSSAMPYDSAKIEPPKGQRSPDPTENGLKTRRGPKSSMTLEERFNRIVRLFECAIDDRLSILEEDDPLKREELLTSDIDDQIGHWQAIEKEFNKLKEQR